MSDDRFEPVDLTGRWVGFYRHRCEQLGSYPIVAELHHTGDRITGEMYDQITGRSDYVDDFYAVIRQDISHQAGLAMEMMIKRFGQDAVRHSRLPDVTDIYGNITGRRLKFTKAYRGAYEVKWTVQEHEVLSVRRNGHKVEYSGDLDWERMCVVGEWVIRHRGLFGWVLPPEASGRFELYRKSYWR
jgi:hypothetical protein